MNPYDDLLDTERLTAEVLAAYEGETLCWPRENTPLNESVRWFLRTADKGGPKVVLVGMNPSGANRLPRLEEVREGSVPGGDKTVRVLIQQLKDPTWPLRKHLDDDHDTLSDLDRMQVVMLNVVPWRSPQPGCVPTVVRYLSVLAGAQEDHQLTEAAARVTRSLIKVALRDAAVVIPMWGTKPHSWLMKGLSLIGDDLICAITDHEVPVLSYGSAKGLPCHCGFVGQGHWRTQEGFKPGTGTIENSLRKARR